MSIQESAKIIKAKEEDELYNKALRVLEAIDLLEHEDWRKSSVFYPRREGKYIFWEKMYFRYSAIDRIVRCFVCPKCNRERTIGAHFNDREGLLLTTILEEDCFFCNSDKFESLVIDIIEDNTSYE